MQNSGSTAPAPTALFPETRHCRALFRTGCRRCLFAFPWPEGSKGEQAQMELKLTGIRKHFGEKEVLRGCGFTFQQGKIYGLLGRNGAGKTTLFNCLTDEVPPDGGTAELVLEDGTRRALNPDDVGYVFATPDMNSCVFIWTSMLHVFGTDAPPMIISTWCRLLRRTGTGSSRDTPTV